MYLAFDELNSEYLPTLWHLKEDVASLVPQETATANYFIVLLDPQKLDEVHHFLAISAENYLKMTFVKDNYYWI